MKKQKIAVLIPCYNEEMTVGKVVTDFKEQLPEAQIFVYDNNSKDSTTQKAQEAGATVIFERNQGKGNVVRSMFRDIDADIYVLVDGDDTYPADEVNKLVDAIKDGYDMVIGDRLSSTYFSENKRPFHNFGNTLVRWLINKIFNNNFKDIMTGYRAFSRKFVKTIPIMSPGFQIETELTITASVYRYQITSVPIQYRDRPKGSSSKLNTISDGIKVLLTLFNLAKNNKPLLFFSCISLFFIIAGVITLMFNINSVNTAYNLILSCLFFIISLLFVVTGLVLDHQANIDKQNHELYVNDWVQKHNK